MKVKPTKHHYRRALKQFQAHQMINQHNELADTVLFWTRAATIWKTSVSDRFESYYPTELALSYGFTHGLLALGELSNDGYFAVVVTQAALQDILRLREQVWRRN